MRRAVCELRWKFCVCVSVFVCSQCWIPIASSKFFERRRHFWQIYVFVRGCCKKRERKIYGKGKVSGQNNSKVFTRNIVFCTCVCVCARGREGRGRASAVLHVVIVAVSVHMIYCMEMHVPCEHMDCSCLCCCGAFCCNKTQICLFRQKCDRRFSQP